MTAPDSTDLVKLLCDRLIAAQNAHVAIGDTGQVSDDLSLILGQLAGTLIRVGSEHSVAQAVAAALLSLVPPRVFREGDPMPTTPMNFLDREGDFMWHDPGDADWDLYVSTYGPLVQVILPDYDAAVAADEATRARRVQS